jgi:putative aminopeptidase FrvX
LYPVKIGEGPVEIVGDEGTLLGVLSMGSMHVADAAGRAVGWGDVRVMTGVSVERLKELGVRVGSTAVVARERRGPVVLGDGADPLVGAWTFDDRAGVLTLLRLLKRLKEGKVVPARPMIVAFTVHEEGGCHGAKAVAQRERPEIFLAVDGCPVVPGSPVVADGRPVTWSMDVKCHYDQRLVKGLIGCGRDVGVEVQTVVFRAGAYSDASAVYEVGAAPRVAIIGHARENSHGFEVLRFSALDNVLKVVERFVQVVE